MRRAERRMTSRAKKTAGMYCDDTSGSLFGAAAQSYGELDCVDAQEERTFGRQDGRNERISGSRTDANAQNRCMEHGYQRRSHRRGAQRKQYLSEREQSAAYVHSHRSRRRGASAGGRDLCTDNAKALLILLVVIGHLLLPLARTPLVNGLIYLIYSFHMPCFVLLSGFYAKSAVRDGRFRWGKLVQFLWLYLIFKLMLDITEGLLAGEVPLWPDLLHESGAPWYLLALFFWYLLLPLAARIAQHGAWARGGALLAVLLLCVFGKYGVHLRDFFAIDRVIGFAPFFFCGYFWQEEGLVRFEHARRRFVYALLLLVLGLGAAFAANTELYQWHLIVYGADYHRYPMSLWPSLWAVNLGWYALALIMSLGLLALSPGRWIPVWSRIGRYTLQIYILHRPIRDLLQYAGVLSPERAASPVFLLLLFCFGAALCVLLSSQFVSKLSSWIWKAPDPLLRKLRAL